MNNSSSDYYFYILKVEFTIDILILCVGLLVIGLTIYGLYRMIRSNMVVPIYIINLLIADLLQVIMRPAFLPLSIKYLYKYNTTHSAAEMVYGISDCIFSVGVCASVWFMVCISLERYLLVAHPLWYRNRRSIRHTALVSVGVWVLALIFLAIFYIAYYSYLPCYACDIQLPFFFILPFPLLVFFFIGTWRAIASTTSVRDAEKRRIRCTLALVLGAYTVLILPNYIVHMIWLSGDTDVSNAYIITYEMIKLNALVDPVLYIFLRPDVRNTLGSLPCCQRLFTLTNCWTPSAEQEEMDNMPTVCPTETVTGV